MTVSASTRHRLRRCGPGAAGPVPPVRCSAGTGVSRSGHARLPRGATASGRGLAPVTCPGRTGRHGVRWLGEVAPALEGVGRAFGRTGPDGDWVVLAALAGAVCGHERRREAEHAGRGQKRRGHCAQGPAWGRGQPLAGRADEVTPGDRCRRVAVVDEERGAARRPRPRGVAASGPGSSGARHRPACLRGRRACSSGAAQLQAQPSGRADALQRVEVHPECCRARCGDAVGMAPVVGG